MADDPRSSACTASASRAVESRIDSASDRPARRTATCPSVLPLISTASRPSLIVSEKLLGVSV